MNHFKLAILMGILLVIPCLSVNAMHKEAAVPGTTSEESSQIPTAKPVSRKIQIDKVVNKLGSGDVHLELKPNAKFGSFVTAANRRALVALDEGHIFVHVGNKPAWEIRIDDQTQEIVLSLASDPHQIKRFNIRLESEPKWINIVLNGDEISLEPAR